MRTGRAAFVVRNNVRNVGAGIYRRRTGIRDRRIDPHSNRIAIAMKRPRAGRDGRMRIALVSMRQPIALDPVPSELSEGPALAGSILLAQYL